MEEQVGAAWHRLITRIADPRHHAAAVALSEVQRPLGVFFRALGGDGGLQVEAADATANRARRSWLQRLAGVQEKVELAWLDERSLRLPPRIAWFERRELNLDLYFWLAALAAVGARVAPAPWLARSQALTRQALSDFPGLGPRYRRLVEAHLDQRPDLGDDGRRRGPRASRRREQDRAAEQAIRHALREPGSVAELPPTRRPPAAVPLWLHPEPPLPARPESIADADPADQDAQAQKELDDLGRRQAERVDHSEEERGLVTVRMETIFTFGEYVAVDRSSEDEDDLGRAEEVARDLDRIAVSRERRSSAPRLKFDLDLPAEAEDDAVLDDGLLLPEWDWRRQVLRPDHCRIVQMVADEAEPLPLPVHLGRTAKRLRNQFQALAPARVWHRAQPDGQEVDIDAYLRFASDRAAGHATGGDRLYRELRSGARELACLLLADLSLSTDTWVNDYHRVIDVIRDSLFLFAESLGATGDRFGMFGFSSRKRDPVRVHQLKDFDEPYNARIRGRIQLIKPGYYTRLGAGVRYATERLADQPANRRLLLILTDGKPNDLDQYEGRYGIEDTRHAVLAARRLGLQPFCVTIDQKGNDYLPHLFGSDSYVVIRDPSELPQRLPLLYARLTA